MTSNPKFEWYATRTAFNLSLSAPQVEMLWWLCEQNSRYYPQGWADKTIAALIRKGLAVDESNVVSATRAGTLALALADEAGLVQKHRDHQARIERAARAYGVREHPGFTESELIRR